MTPQKNLQPLTQRMRRVLPWLKIAFVAAVLMGAVIFAGDIAESSHTRAFVESYGYVGAFVIGVVSGFNLVVPVPAIALIPAFVLIGLDPVFTVIVIAAGMTCADLLAFLLGTSGRQLIAARKVHFPAMKKLQDFRRRHERMPLLVMFVYAAAAPFPNEVLAIPLGLMGYRVRDVTLPLLFGNIIFNGVAAVFLLGAAQSV